MDFNGFYWILVGFDGFYWVLIDYNGFGIGLFWLLLSLLFFTGFYWILLGFARFQWVLMGFPGFYLVLMGFSGFFWVLLGSVGFCWVLPSFAGWNRKQEPKQVFFPTFPRQVSAEGAGRIAPPPPPPPHTHTHTHTHTKWPKNTKNRATEFLRFLISKKVHYRPTPVSSTTLHKETLGIFSGIFLPVSCIRYLVFF